MERKYEKLSFINNGLVLAAQLNPQVNSINAYLDKKLIFPFGYKSKVSR